MAEVIITAAREQVWWNDIDGKDHWNRKTTVYVQYESKSQQGQENKLRHMYYKHKMDMDMSITKVMWVT